MEVRITEIRQKNDHTMVRAENSLGGLWGVWHFGDAPEKGKVYMIELTFYDVSADAVRILDSAAQGFSTDNDNDIFTAECESVDPDGLIYLRLAPDGLEMLDIGNTIKDIKAGDILQFSIPAERVGIYPY